MIPSGLLSNTIRMQITLSGTLSILILSILNLLKPTSAYYLTIDAHAEECFFDRVSTGTKMGLTFEVIDGGFYDIDVKITGMFIGAYDSVPLLY